MEPPPICLFGLQITRFQIRTLLSSNDEYLYRLYNPAIPSFSIPAFHNLDHVSLVEQFTDHLKDWLDTNFVERSIRNKGIDMPFRCEDLSTVTLQYHDRLLGNLTRVDYDSALHIKVHPKQLTISSATMDQLPILNSTYLILQEIMRSSGNMLMGREIFINNDNYGADTSSLLLTKVAFNCQSLTNWRLQTSFNLDERSLALELFGLREIAFCLATDFENYVHNDISTENIVVSAYRDMTDLSFHLVDFETFRCKTIGNPIYHNFLHVDAPSVGCFNSSVCKTDIYDFGLVLASTYTTFTKKAIKIKYHDQDVPVQLNDCRSRITNNALQILLTFCDRTKDPISSNNAYCDELLSRLELLVKKCLSCYCDQRPDFEDVVIQLDSMLEQW